jgi:hypothetical protein
MALNRHIPPSKAQQLTRQGQLAFRRQLAAEDAAISQRLSKAYGGVLRDLRDRLAIFRDVAGDKNMTTRQLLNEAATLRLKDDAKDAFKGMSREIDKAARSAETSGISAGRGIGASSIKATISSGFNQPTVEQIRATVGYVDSTAFRQKIAQYGEYHAEHISDIILSDASMGKGPLTTARHVIQYVQDMPRADAVRMARTVQLWSARRGALEVYRANADIVKGWIWSASLDATVCMACVSMHGSFHELDEICNDHFSGRCAMVPVTTAWADLGFDSGQEVTAGIQTGQEWFNDMPESDQRQRMGPSMFDAYKDGIVSFNQLTTTTTDDLYGPMRHRASLESIVGKDTADAYKRRKAA